jgi:membrane protease YdiL (CAAX protease family)
MLFRGFLLPLLVRSIGPWLGIILTAVPFALLHGAQNHWAWQPVLLIGIAGIAFGYVRYKTGSTTAAFLMHAAYNATGFLGYTLTHWQTLN